MLCGEHSRPDANGILQITSIGIINSVSLSLTTRPHSPSIIFSTTPNHVLSRSQTHAQDTRRSLRRDSRVIEVYTQGTPLHFEHYSRTITAYSSQVYMQLMNNVRGAVKQSRYRARLI